MSFGEALRHGPVIRVATVTPYCGAVPADDKSVCLISWTQSMPQGGFDAGTGWVGMTKPAETSLILIACKKLGKRGTCALDRATMRQNPPKNVSGLPRSGVTSYSSLICRSLKTTCYGVSRLEPFTSGEVMC
jgi:hypothetical protein